MILHKTNDENLLNYGLNIMKNLCNGGSINYNYNYS